MLIGHHAELSNCLYNFDCSLIASSSMDKTAKIWDVRMNSCLATLLGHDDEVLDLAFENNDKKLATASSDTTARIWDISSNFQQLALMKGHREEISKGKFLIANKRLATISYSFQCTSIFYKFIYSLFQSKRPSTSNCFLRQNGQVMVYR